MKTPYGNFSAGAIRLRNAGREMEHFCLYRGIRENCRCLLRLNSACMTSELFGCARCDCSWQLAETLRRFRLEESCALIYSTTDEGRGHGLIAKLRAYSGSDGTANGGLRQRYVDTLDLRDFGSQAFAAQWLGVRQARLLSNNDAKRIAVSDAGIDLLEVIDLRSAEPVFRDFYRFRDTVAADRDWTRAGQSQHR